MSLILPVVFAIGSMLGFGLADFIAKAILTKSNTYRTLLISQSIGTVPFLAAISFDAASPSQAVSTLALACGVVSAALMVAYYSALRLGKATIVSPVSGCISAFAVVLSILFLHETLSIAQITLVTAVVFGILLVAFSKNREDSSSSRLSIALALVVVILGGGNAIIQKLIATGDHILVSFAIVRLSFVGSLLALLPFFGGFASLKETRKGWATMGFLGVVDALAFFSMFMGFKTGLVSIVAPIATASPVVTIILAGLFLSERVSFRQKLGVTTIITSIMILAAIA